MAADHTLETTDLDKVVKSPRMMDGKPGCAPVTMILRFYKFSDVKFTR